MKYDLNGIHPCLDYANLVGDDIRATERNADVLLNACKDICLAVNISNFKYMETDYHWNMATLLCHCYS